MTKDVFIEINKMIKENTKLNDELILLKNQQNYLESWLYKTYNSKSFKIWQAFNKIKKIILMVLFPIKFIFLFLSYLIFSIIFFIPSFIQKFLSRIVKRELKLPKKDVKLDGISFIIPTWNKRDLVVDCLKILDKAIASESPDIKKEIIVMENGSFDGSYEAIKKLKLKTKLKVIKLKNNLGFGKAVNLGVLYSKYNYIYLLNNDMFVQKGFLLNIVNFAKSLLHKKVHFFGISSQIFFHDQNKRREESGKTYFKFKFGFLEVAHFVEDINLKKPSFTAYPGGGSSLINKKLFLLMGGFDHKSYTPLYCEDLDLGFVAWKLGFPSYFVPSSKVIHFHRSSSKNLNRDPNYYMYKNWLVFILKNIEDMRLIIKQIFIYPLLMLNEKRFIEYFLDVIKNFKNIYKSRNSYNTFARIYKDNQLMEFIKFEIDLNEKKTI